MAPSIEIKGPVLLLMGPIGTFFSRVAEHLGASGIDVYKVSFPLKEHGFAKRIQLHFPGNVQTEFDPFLRKIIQEKGIRHIFMYGDFIIPHRIAIEIARELEDVDSWVFELGYLRPNYVTLENGYVNCRSCLNQPQSFYENLVDPGVLPQARQDVGPRWRKLWKAPTFIHHALTNYIICDKEHKLQPKPSYIYCQFRGFTRKYIYQLTERSIRREVYSGLPFFLVVLQVATDSQLYNGSPYQNVEQFIELVIKSFTENAPAGARLVFKHHPRDRGYTHYGDLIRDYAEASGCRDRIFYFHDAPLGRIFRSNKCRGCVLINSSVGFQALFHGVPLKCLGRAPYNIEGLADQQSLDSFWGAPKASNRELFRKFYMHTLEKTQINGNFDGYFPFRDTFVIDPKPGGLEATSGSQEGLGKQHTRRRAKLNVITRLACLASAYGLYALHWLAWIAGRRDMASRLFEKSARRCLRAFGIRVAIDRRDTIRSKRAEIHIANHDSPLDVLLIHGYFCMPSITTAQLHLRWLVPGFRHAASRYGHILLDYRCKQSRTMALYASGRRLSTISKLFVFPSGSLKTSIEERFSPSVAFLARQHDALLIPWKISYQLEGPTTRSGEGHDYNPIALLVSRLTGPRLLIQCREQEAVDPRDFADNEGLTIALQSVYGNKQCLTLERRQADDGAVAEISTLTCQKTEAA